MFYFVSSGTLKVNQWKGLSPSTAAEWSWLSVRAAIMVGVVGVIAVGTSTACTATVHYVVELDLLEPAS